MYADDFFFLQEKKTILLCLYGFQKHDEGSGAIKFFRTAAAIVILLLTVTIVVVAG